MAYVNVGNHLLVLVASCSHAKKTKKAQNVTAVVRVTKRLDYVLANKVLQVKAVNYNVKINVTTMAVVLQKHLNVHCVIVSRASEVLLVKYKLAAPLGKTRHAPGMAIV